MSISLSKSRIGNLALSHIGISGRIENFELEDSNEANAIKQWYDFCRCQTLAGHDWGFARKRLVLALTDEQPDQDRSDWLYSYTYPDDCVAFREIWNPLGPHADAVPYEIETDEANEFKRILTNMEEAKGIYTRDVQATDAFTAHFIEALSYNLAWRIAWELTKNSNTVNAARGSYNRTMREAPAQDGNERIPHPPRDTDWIRER